MENKIKKIINSRHTIIVLTLFLICLVAITGTYAWFTWNSEENTELTMTIGDIADVIFSTGNDITTSLTPVFNYTSGEKTNFTIKNNDNTGGMLLYTITLNITSIPEVLRNEQVKYALEKNDKLIREGDLSNAVDGSSIDIYTNNLVPGSTDFDFYIYIDSNEENDRNMIEANLKGNIMVEGSEYTPSTIATFISDLYTTSDKTVVTNNNIEYNNANAVVLMNDRLGGTTEDYNAGNIRYYGPYVENYIYFNCNDYDNPSASTCEKWRIIGNFDGMTKILRNEIIGLFAYDNKTAGLGSSTSIYGSDDWNDARLMMLLNDGYENGATDADGENIYEYEGSLYWNAGGTSGANGTCYAGQGNATTSCDFTPSSSTPGLKNDKTRNLIAETTWNINQNNYLTNAFSNEFYVLENTGGSTWNGAITIPYVSDYSYAVDFNKCTVTLSNYKTCVSSNWMNNIFILNTPNYTAYYFLNPNSNSESGTIVLAHFGTFSSGGVRAGNGIVPTLHLNTQTMISGGDGSYENPYIIY